jgi:hypothetical protein
MWEMGLPRSPVEFSSLCHSHKLSRSWLLGTRCRSHPILPGPACLFTVPGGIPLPPSLALRALHPLFYVSLLFLLLITQFLYFPWVGGWYVQGAMLIWPRVVCGSTAVPLSSPCSPCLPKLSGCWCLVAVWGPSWFLHST